MASPLFLISESSPAQVAEDKLHYLPQLALSHYLTHDESERMGR